MSRTLNPPHRRCPAAAAVLTTAALLNALTGCQSSGTPRARPQHQPPPGPLTAFSPLTPPATVDAGFTHDVTTKVARGLHLSEAAISARLDAAPGSTLMNLAKPAGFSQDALARIGRDALADATNARESSGRWSADQAQATTSFWASQTDPAVISQISYWYTHP